jgi:DDE superfamily endonuclease
MDLWAEAAPCLKGVLFLPSCPRNPWVADTRAPIPATPGQPECIAYAYTRKGQSSCFRTLRPGNRAGVTRRAASRGVSRPKMPASELLKKQEDAGEIDLRYFDASGFCLMPYIPYAWQEKGQPLTVEIDAHSKRLNVLGFLNRQNDLATYTFEGRIDSEVVIACSDDFCQDLHKKTVIVMDQTFIHTSQEVTAKTAAWKEQHLEIFYLPLYSPELNIIEILWRFMKYEWIGLWAYKSWNHIPLEK